MRVLIAILIGLLIGGSCRYFNIPLPAPQKLVGVLLILAITIGYIVIDKWLK